MSKLAKAFFVERPRIRQTSPVLHCTEMLSHIMIRKGDSDYYDEKKYFKDMEQNEPLILKEKQTVAKSKPVALRNTDGQVECLEENLGI